MARRKLVAIPWGSTAPAIEIVDGKQILLLEIDDVTGIIYAGSLAITSNSGGSAPAGVSWTSGNGSPNGVVTANVGSQYSRLDGGSNTTLYIKEAGSGNLGWVAK